MSLYLFHKFRTYGHGAKVLSATLFSLSLKFWLVTMWIWFQKVKDPDELKMPRGFSLKRKSGSKSGGSSPLKDDGNFIIKQDGENEQYSVAELAKLYFRSPGYPPHFTRTEIKQPLLKATPDEFKVVSIIDRTSACFCCFPWMTGTARNLG